MRRSPESTLKCSKRSVAHTMSRRRIGSHVSPITASGHLLIGGRGKGARMVGGHSRRVYRPKLLGRAYRRLVSVQVWRAPDLKSIFYFILNFFSRVLNKLQPNLIPAKYEHPSSQPFKQVLNTSAQFFFPATPLVSRLKLLGSFWMAARPTE